MQLLFSKADVVIIGDEVWIRVDEKAEGPTNDYEREDIIHAEGYDPARATYDYSSWGRGWAGSGSTGRYPRRESSDGYHFDRARESDPLESWCDYLSDKARRQESFYNQMNSHIWGKDDGIRNFPGFGV